MSDIVVVGCGIFGALSALRLGRSGHNVTVVERLSAPMRGASRNNQNRLHLGFHYPRSPETAQQCIDGYARFAREYDDCILGNFKNAYCIASEHSMTSPEDYLAFCDSVKLEYEICPLENFPIKINGVDLCILTGEGVYDSRLVGEKIMRRFNDTKIETVFETEVIDAKNVGDEIEVTLSNGTSRVFSGLVNTTYANQNRLNGMLGFDTPVRQFEYTAVPIIKTSFGTLGVTIMDGGFMTVLPYGKNGSHLLYHVKSSVLETQHSQYLDPKWLDSETSPFANRDQAALFSEFQKACASFIPDIKNAELAGFLHGPRMVLTKKDDTDARPSVVERLQSNYVSVFSGKTDHATWVAGEVGEHLKHLL